MSSLIAYNMLETYYFLLNLYIVGNVYMGISCYAHVQHLR